MTSPMALAEIGIFGGSGLYQLIERAEEMEVNTPYGSPSDTVTLGTIGGRRVAFLPRHGVRHQYPPHTIPYLANLWAMKSLGVNRILAPCAVGSLQPQVKPGNFVICDQFVDRTSGRRSTFYDGPITTHISAADPYCPELSETVIKAGREMKLPIHEKGTVVVVQGPRFSSRAESRWFKGVGWEVINMTQYPEVVLARELEICYGNISLVTDYDVWQDEPVSHDQVMKTFEKNIDTLKKLLFAAIPKIPKNRKCPCSTALQKARL